MTPISNLSHLGWTVVSALAMCLLGSAPTSAQAAIWQPGPEVEKPALRQRLYEIGRRYGDDHFDAEAGLIKSKKNPAKASNFMLRESAYYAYGLLLTKDPEERQKAEKIIRVIASKQDLRADQPTFGCIPPYSGDDWESSTVKDPNYTQFIGLALGEMLNLDNQQNHALSGETRGVLEKTFRLAVEATIRRDVEPGYTNISLLSAAVGAAGDKLLGVPGARDFALSKLHWILSRALPGTTLTEYLSPTYYGVDLDGAYAVKKFANSPEIAAAAERIINYLWQDISAAYHAPTYQLAGPHARSYGIDMLKYAAGLKYFVYLALDGKYPLVDEETAHEWDAGGLPLVANLPVETRPEFRAVPVPWREINVDVYSNSGARRLIRQFRSGDFVLGSISGQSVWQQQRNVVAYWPGKGDEGPVHFFQDLSPLTFGNGYANFRAVQVKGAVLVSLSGKQPVPAQGGLRLGFNSSARVTPLPDGPPGSYMVEDAGVTAWLYPVSPGHTPMTVRTDADGTYVERLWSSADVVSNFQVMSYLAVFQLPGEAKPVVKNISFQAVATQATLNAEVNGSPLTLTITR